MKFLVNITLALGLTLGLSVAQAAEKKRTPATPPGAVGMPKPPGSGMPPGAVGMPVPLDASCRRAAGMAAVKEALEDNDNNVDCSVISVHVVKANLVYNVTVSCGEDDKETNDETSYTVKTRVKSKKSNACRATSVEVKE